jgi:hypothetical protein
MRAKVDAPREEIPNPIKKMKMGEKQNKKVIRN